jgi:hypothetical protein
VAISRISHANGTYSLVFSCGELPADDAVRDSGHEPNGYFWEGVATLLAPDLVDALELDSEAGLFDAVGALPNLERLQAVLEPVISSPDHVRAAIVRAETEGFEFDD